VERSPRVTDYQGLAVATPGWRRALVLLGCGALLVLAGFGALAWWGLRTLAPAPVSASLDAGSTP